MDRGVEDVFGTKKLGQVDCWNEIKIAKQHKITMETIKISNKKGRKDEI